MTHNEPDRSARIKKTNAYAALLDPKVYESIPKAVFAALAVSFATHGDPWNPENGGTAQELILNEWQILHENDIVPQRPPGTRP